MTKRIHSTHRQRIVRLGTAVVATATLLLTACTPTSPTPGDPSVNPSPTSSSDPGESGLPTGLEPQPLDEPVTLIVNTSIRAETFTALFLGHYLGEFEKENITLEFTNLSTADAMPGLGQNQIHVAGLSPTASVFNAIESGVNVRIVAPAYVDNPGRDGLWVRKDLAEQGPEALKGATIGSGVGIGSPTSTFTITDYLAPVGLTLSDVTVQTFPIADVPLALTNGAIQGAYVTAPTTLTVDSSGCCEFVQGLREGAGSAIVTYGFGPLLLEEQPLVATAFIRALVRTMKVHLVGDYKSNPQTVTDLAAALERTEAEILANPSLVFGPDLTFREDMYVELQKLWIEHTDVLSYSTPLDAGQVIDSRFLDAVLSD